MPYIRKEVREKFDPHLMELSRGLAKGGELSYCVFVLAKRMLGDDANARYEDRARVYGILQATCREFSRRYLDEYEAHMCKENGDV